MYNWSQEIQSVLCFFAPLFSTHVYLYAQILAIGAILCPRKRTVTAALKIMGLGQDPHFCNYYRVLNRAKWNMLHGAKILLGLLIHLIPEGMPVLIGVDETIERRKGSKIKAKGCYRDAVRSTEKKVVLCFGLKWISMMLIVPVPWSRRPWALPFLTVLAPSKACNAKEGKRHKTTVDWTRRMIMLVRRWLPSHAIVLVGDGGYAAVALALCCAGLPVPVTLVSRLRLDAALYDFPPDPIPGKRGPKPKKGKRQTSLQDRINDPSTIWIPVKVIWYDGIERALEIISGVSLWWTPGQPPVPIKWVIVRDPKGDLRTEAFFSTCLEASPAQIIRWFILRWNVEVTFAELRAHLGVETQRQWSNLAIARTIPTLFALYSIVILMAQKIIKDGLMPVKSFAWYSKSETTFSDVIALVRRRIWSSMNYTNSSPRPDSKLFQDDFLNVLLDQLCYAA
jgi:DDE superfamily endonuclease